MSYHHQLNKRHQLHDRHVARQAPPDVVSAVDAPQGAPTSSIHPPASSSAPSQAPPSQDNGENQSTRSPPSSSRNSPPATPLPSSSDFSVQDSVPPSLSSSSVPDSSSSPTQSSSSSSLTSLASVSVVRPTETVIITSSFRSITQSRFVNTALASPTTAPSAGPTASSGLSSGAIVGAVGGGIVGVAILIFLSMFIVRRIRKNSYHEHFDSATFRRSAIMLNDDNGMSRNTASSFGAARPPTMIERQLATHPVAPSPVPQAYGNYDDFDLGAPPQPQRGAYDAEYDAGFAGAGAYNSYNHRDEVGGYGHYNTSNSGGQAYANDAPLLSSGSAAVTASRVARSNKTAPRDSRVISRVDDADVYGGI